MSEIHQLPAREDAEREASEWIARLNAEDVSGEDQLRFESWRRANPRNSRAYDEMSATWGQFIAAGRTVRAVSFGNAMQTSAEIRRPDRWRAPLLATAATLAVIAVGWWWQLQAVSSFQTGVGEHATVNLPDGSRLELNSDSAVRVDYDENSRVIHLDRGEAFFTVAHNKQRPFWVVADRAWVRAVGTAFNVYRREYDVRITVSEGRVKVATPNGDATSPSDQALARLPNALLIAGQQADLRGANATVRALPQPEINRQVSWRGGTVYFENKPLGEVVQELGRYTPLQIELEATLQSLPVGGTFQTNPQGAEALLRMLQDGWGLHVHRDEGQRVRVE